MISEYKILVCKSRLVTVGAGLAMVQTDLVLAQNTLVDLGYYQTPIYTQLQHMWLTVRILQQELNELQVAAPQLITTRDS